MLMSDLLLCNECWDIVGLSTDPLAKNIKVKSAIINSLGWSILSLCLLFSGAVSDVLVITFHLFEQWS